MKIYADYNATSPINPKVKQFIAERMEGVFANPNAIHALGSEIKREIEVARKHVADLLGADPEQIIFTSGSTESISSVFYQFLNDRPFGNDKKNLVISSKLEHSAVMNSISYLEKLNFLVSKWIDSSNDGTVNLESFRSLFKEYKEKIALVTTMSVNNEIGTIQPIEEMIELCMECKIPFLSDTTQHLGKLKFHFEQSKLDFAVLSGHKLGVPFGIGALLIKNPSKFKPMILGGHQEMGLRGGTQNYLGILSLSIALQEELSASAEAQWKMISKEKNEFEQELKKLFPNVVIFGENAPRRIGNTTLCSFPGIHGQGIQIECESRNIFFTTSSACSDNEPETSRVLKSMDVPDNVGRGVIRISTGKTYQKGDYQKILKSLQESLKKLKF
ncbi:MAG: cysteine desulfurase family protein [Bacteriovoracaceae bacterium]|nr:cysteine desulfurase family protein [Bacteriovoracaceae bacterium]